MDGAIDLLPLVSTGFGVGFMIGLTGVAGAALMTPLLISVFGVPAPVAIGTDLLYASITKMAAVWRHHVAGHIVWRLVLFLALGSIPVSLGVIAVLAQTGLDEKALAHTLRVALAVMLPISALAIVLRPFFMRQCAVEDGEARFSKGRLAVVVLLGALLGFAVTLTSVGAGAIGVPVLALLFPALAAKRIVGTDIAHAAALALVAGLGHLGLGQVDFKLLGALLVGSIPGIIIGSALCDRAPDWLLRPVLGVTLCYAAYLMVTTPLN